MTFDETIEKFEQEANEYNGLVPMETVYELILDLRQEYAPTVEMTKEQAEDLNRIIREVGEVFEPDEIPADVKVTDKVIELESSYILFKYLNTILHPETIKIIEGDNK